MPWQDRLREGAYTSPGGARLLFQYENVSKAIDKKTSAWDFPDADGTYIQDLGNTGRRYPFRLFFVGDDHDLAAAEFEAALLERGTGKLEHPAYGVFDVVPFGTITLSNAFKTAANQSIIEVIFWETTGLIYPTAQTDPASEVTTAVEEYNVAASTEFEEVTALEGATEQAQVKNAYQLLLDKATIRLQGIADAQEDVSSQFNATVDSINRGIDTLIAEPLTLAFQTTIALQAPARARVSIGARLSAYRDLADALISGDGAVVGGDNSPNESNEFHTKDLYASTYVTGAVVSTLNNQFVTKVEALEAAEDVLSLFEDVAAWRDLNYDALGEIDTGGTYQKLQEAAAITAGFLVEISFTLKQERRVTLEHPRTIVDLAAELYGEVDAQLDFLITSNDLTGSEILEIPRGREIVYYR